MRLRARAQLAEFADGGAIDLRRAGAVRRAVRLLCARVRPDAVALCDAFDLDDFTLNSCIGRHDGEAYKARAAPAGQKVTDLGGGSWLYKLPINLVGSLVVAAGAYAGPGTLTVHHCERLNASAATPTCAALSGLQALP